MHVLLIESDRTLQNLFVKGLLARGFTVDAAENVHTGLLALIGGTVSYDAIIWDIGNPATVYQALLDALQETRRLHIPLIVVSDKALSRRAFATLSRANHVLLKPLSIRGLVALVASLATTSVI